MEVPSRSVLTAICLNISERSWVPSVVKLEECFKKNSLLASLTRSESWLNTLAWLGLSALYQGRTSCLLELGVFPESPLEWFCPEAYSGEGYHLLGLGDCLGAGVGGVAEVSCSSTGEVLCGTASRGDRGVCPNKMW